MVYEAETQGATRLELAECRAQIASLHKSGQLGLPRARVAEGRIREVLEANLPHILELPLEAPERPELLHDAVEGMAALGANLEDLDRLRPLDADGVTTPEWDSMAEGPLARSYAEGCSIRAISLFERGRSWEALELLKKATAAIQCDRVKVSLRQLRHSLTPQRLMVSGVKGTWIRDVCCAIGVTILGDYFHWPKFVFLTAATYLLLTLLEFLWSHCSYLKLDGDGIVDHRPGAHRMIPWAKVHQAHLGITGPTRRETRRITLRLNTLDGSSHIIEREEPIAGTGPTAEFCRTVLEQLSPRLLRRDLFRYSSSGSLNLGPLCITPQYLQQNDPTRPVKISWSDVREVRLGHGALLISGKKTGQRIAVPMGEIPNLFTFRHLLWLHQPEARVC
jgi:hypothetical protein